MRVCCGCLFFLFNIYEWHVVLVEFLCCVQNGLTHLGLLCNASVDGSCLPSIDVQHYKFPSELCSEVNVVNDCGIVPFFIIIVSLHNINSLKFYVEAMKK